jgi:phage terminase small subunit
VAQEKKKAAQGQPSEARQRLSAATPTGLPPLTAKQEAFVEEYLVDLNSTQAAIRAGYSKHTAKEIGCQNLTKLNVSMAIAEKMKARSARVQLEADTVLRQIKSILTSDIRNYLEYGPGHVALKPSSELTSEQAACIAEVSETVSQTGSSVRLKFHDKLKALDMASRHLGLYAVEKQEHSFIEADTALRDVIRDLVRGGK